MPMKNVIVLNAHDKKMYASAIQIYVCVLVTSWPMLNMILKLCLKVKREKTNFIIIKNRHLFVFPATIQAFQFKSYHSMEYTEMGRLK